MTQSPSRHTKNVALLRRVFLAAALLAGLALIGLSNLDRFDPAPTLDGQWRLGDSGPVIDNPDYQGRSATGRAYRLRGASARQDGETGSRIRQPHIQLAATPTQNAVELRAHQALLSGRGSFETAQLSGDVVMRMGDSHVLSTPLLSAALDTQIITAPQPLRIDGPRLVLSADTLSADLAANILTLKNITMTLTPKAGAR